MKDTCGCSRPLSGGVLCMLCASELEQVIVELPAMIGYLYDTMGGQVRFSNGRVGGRSAEKPPAINETAKDVATLVRVPLRRITRQLIETGAVHPMRMPADELTPMALFILNQLHHVRRLDDAYELLGELQQVTRRIVGVINRPLDRAYAGVCSAQLADGGECSEELYAVQGAKFIACRACGFRHDVDDRRKVLRAAAEDTNLTTKQIRDFLPGWFGVEINPATLRKWRQRGRLVAKTVNYQGEELFRCGDVIDLATEAAARNEQKAG